MPTDHDDDIEVEQTGAETDSDVQSDPALDDGKTADWASEGGATPQGPAEDTSQ